MKVTTAGGSGPIKTSRSIETGNARTVRTQRSYCLLPARLEDLDNSMHRKNRYLALFHLHTYTSITEQ